MVFLQGGGANHLDLAAREGGLEDVGGVHRTFRTARPHERVDLIEEQDAVLRILRFLDELLETLLELSAVHRAGDHARHVERDHPLAAHPLRGVPGGDRFGETLHDGRLADARLADQHGVVLRAAGKDLENALNLGLASDHGIQFALGGGFREIASVGVERGRLLFLAAFPLALLCVGGLVFVRLVRCRRFLLVVRQLGRFGVCCCGALAVERLEEGVGRDLVSEEDLRPHRFTFAQHGEHDVFGTDLVGLHADGLDLRELQHLLCAGGQRKRTPRHEGVAPPDHPVELHAEVVVVETEPGQAFAGVAVLHLEDAGEDMFRADVGVVVVPRNGFRAIERLLCVRGVDFVHVSQSLANALRRTPLKRLLTLSARIAS